MNLSESTIGELYSTLSELQTKRLSAYIKANGNATTLRLHQLLVKWKEDKKFETMDLNALQRSLYQDKPVVKSSFTTQINILQTMFKEFILLSKINDKNIYTETLWGEYLIENRLKRNLLIKLNNYKLDIFKDDYPFQKDFYHKREQLFYTYFNSTKSNQKLLFNDVINEIEAFKNFEISKKLEEYIGLTSTFINKKGFNIDLNMISRAVDKGLNSNYPPIKINALVLNLIINETFEYYEKLKTTFMEVYYLYSIDSLSQIATIIINFGLRKMDNGDKTFSVETYNFYLFLGENEILFSKSFFNQNHMNRYINLCIKHDSSQRARTILEEHINKLPKTQIESCYNLNLARIEFAEKNYKLAVRLLYQIDTNQNIFYLPLTKILLLKNLVELEDMERLTTEKENFYKYYHTSKTLPDNIKKKYTPYNKYIEQMLSVKYEFMSEYKRKKISFALQDDSPYFIEKEWMKGRWKRLQEKFGE